VEVSASSLPVSLCLRKVHPPISLGLFSPRPNSWGPGNLVVGSWVGIHHTSNHSFYFQDLYIWHCPSRFLLPSGSRPWESRTKNLRFGSIVFVFVFPFLQDPYQARRVPPNNFEVIKQFQLFLNFTSTNLPSTQFEILKPFGIQHGWIRSARQRSFLLWPRCLGSRAPVPDLVASITQASIPLPSCHSKSINTPRLDPHDKPPSSLVAFVSIPISSHDPLLCRFSAPKLWITHLSKTRSPLLFLHSPRCSYIHLPVLTRVF
jgi:hypothetical protein